MATVSVMTKRVIIEASGKVVYELVYCLIGLIRMKVRWFGKLAYSKARPCLSDSLIRHHGRKWLKNLCARRLLYWIQLIIGVGWLALICIDSMYVYSLFDCFGKRILCTTETNPYIIYCTHIIVSFHNSSDSICLIHWLLVIWNVYHPIGRSIHRWCFQW